MVKIKINPKNPYEIKSSNQNIFKTFIFILIPIIFMGAGFLLLFSEFIFY